MSKTLLAFLSVVFIFMTAGCGSQDERVTVLYPSAEGAQIFPNWELIHRTLLLKFAAFSQDGKTGWAIDPYGGLLHYRGGQWRDAVEVGESESGRYTSVWVAPNGNVWLLEPSTLTLLRGSQRSSWRIPRFPGGTGTFLQGALDATSVWIILQDGAILLFRDGKFETRSQGSSSPLTLTSVWLAPDGLNGWGLDEEGGLLRFNGEHWESWKEKVVGRLDDLRVTRDGRYGVAVGKDGSIVEYRTGVWRASDSIATMPDARLNSVWLSSDGKHGWAVGDRGLILSRKSGAWRFDSAASAFSKRDLAGVWGTPDGSRVWITDRTRSFALALKDSRWTIVQDPLQLTPEPLFQVGCSETSWALSARGALFYEEGGKWTERAGPGSAGRQSIWLNSKGNQGWAIGEGGKILRLNGGVWRVDPNPEMLTDAKLLALAFSNDGQVGWAVGEAGAALHYEGGSWRFVRPTHDLLFAVWLSPDGSTGWAASQQGYLRLQHGQWEREDFSDFLFDIAISNGENDVTAWASGQGEVFRFDSGEWRRDQQASGIGETYSDVWLNLDGSTGLMIGQRSALFLERGRWAEDRQPALLSTARLRSACMAPDLKSGWAVGNGGTILRYAPKRIAAANLKPESNASLESFRGRWSLRFDRAVQGVPRLVLVDEDRGVVQAFSRAEYEIDPTPNNPSEFTLELKTAAANLAQRIQGTKQSLQIEANMQHPSMPVAVVFRTAPFYVAGRPLWQKALVTALVVLGVQVLLVAAATRVRWIRTLILHPVGSLFIGAIIGKFLVIDLLVRFVRPIKLAMFRGYRMRLSENSAVATWRGEREYILPDITAQGVSSPDSSGGPIEEGEEAWQQVLRQLLHHPRHRLWLIVGASGLGKTALLENWCGLALEFGETPLLIRLRGSGTAIEEASSLMAQYGDIDVSPEVAFDLLKGGGFVLLLDGFNEDRQPESTRDFVRRIIQGNLVVMTSQFDPGWGERIEVQRIALEPFGRSQLAQLIGEARAEEVLGSPALAEMACLPFAALLLARYLRRHETLPSSEVAIYRDLREGLDTTGLRNLEESAWRLFEAGETELSPGGKLSPEFLDSAVQVGVLTRRIREGKDMYRFAHEKLHRFFVASWLDRQDHRSLVKWYEDAQPGLGRIYWLDVLDFWGKLKAQRSIEIPASLREYLRFLTEVAVFDVEIFARLYAHYDRLCTARVLPSDSEFVGLAARKLAVGVAVDSSR